jgi:hypothetical protein
MTTAGKDHSRKVLLRTAANMWAQGGVKRYYRGLTVSPLPPLCMRSAEFVVRVGELMMLAGFFFPQLGLVGVFPYAAIDMSTFETLCVFQDPAPCLLPPCRAKLTVDLACFAQQTELLRPLPPRRARHHGRPHVWCHLGRRRRDLGLP